MTLIDNGADYNHPVLLTTTVQTDAKYLFFRQDWTWDVSPFETGYCRGRKNISKLSFDWCLIQKHENLNWNADQPTQIQERFYTLPSGWKLKVLGSTINWDDKCHHHILITQLSIPVTKKVNTKQLRTMALYWQKSNMFNIISFDCNQRLSFRIWSIWRALSSQPTPFQVTSVEIRD